MNPKLTTLVALFAVLFGGCQLSSHPATRQITKAPQNPSLKLKQLIDTYQEDRLYGTTRTEEGLPIISDAAVMSKRQYGIDYAELVRRSAQGDSAALERLMRLRLDGMAAEEHDLTLFTLLEGLGDKPFAVALRRCTPKIKRMLKEDLDLARQGSEAKSHAQFPETFGA